MRFQGIPETNVKEQQRQQLYQTMNEIAKRSKKISMGDKPLILRNEHLAICTDADVSNSQKMLEEFEADEKEQGPPSEVP